MDFTNTLSNISNSLANIASLNLNSEQNLKKIKLQEKIDNLNDRLKGFNSKITKIIDKKKLQSQMITDSDDHHKKDGINILCEENDSLSRTYKITTNLKAGAIESLDEMDRQEKILKNTTEKIDTILTKIPYIGKIISDVGYYRFREQVVLGIVTGTCCYLILSVLFK